MMLDLEGKVVLVTGSTRGIGYNIAKMLCSAGCKLIINGRNKSSVMSVAKEFPGSIGIHADVSKPHEAKKLINTVIDLFGRLDGIVCNVGGGKSVEPGEETFKEWNRVLSLNLFSATNIVEAATQCLSKTKGSIVCISSICGTEVVSGAPVTYSAAKAALNSFVKGISRPLGKKSIRINAIAPGNILFKDSVWEKKVNDDSTLVDKMLSNEVSLGMLGDPNDISDLTAYLLSSNAKFVTGAVWNVDGGQTRG